MSLPPVRKRTDYHGISKDDLVFALFYDRIAPTGAMSERAEGATKSDDDAFDALIASPQSQAWLAEKAGQAQADYRAGLTHPADDALAECADLRRWKARAIKAVKAGKSANVRFESAAIAEEEQARIRAVLECAQSAGDVARAFQVKAVAADADALIDEEWDGAMGWAKQAMEE